MKNIITNLIFPIFCLILILILNLKKENIFEIKQEIFFDINKAKEKASENQEIIVFFDAEYSAASYEFKKNLKDKNILEALSEYIICILDFDDNKNIAKEYEIKSIPSYIIINKEGKVIKYGSGYKNKTFFLKWLRSTKNI